MCSILLDYIELRTRINQFEMLKTGMFQKKTALRENHINIESKSRTSQFIYTDVIRDMNILAVVTPSSIYKIQSMIQVMARFLFLTQNFPTSAKETMPFEIFWEWKSLGETS